MNPTDRPSAALAARAALLALQPLAAVGGLDVAAGLRQCGNRAPMYRHMLTRFAEVYAEALPPPTEPEGEPDLPLRERAHSLRGASATVGAVQVQALAAALEALCDDANAPVAERQRAHEELSAAVDTLLTQLRAALALLPVDAPKAG